MYLLCRGIAFSQYLLIDRFPSSVVLEKYLKIFDHVREGRVRRLSRPKIKFSLKLRVKETETGGVIKIIRQLRASHNDSRIVLERSGTPSYGLYHACLDTPLEKHSSPPSWKRKIAPGRL